MHSGFNGIHKTSLLNKTLADVSTIIEFILIKSLRKAF